MELRSAGIAGGMTGQDFAVMKARLTDLQRQLGSGKRAETYGGLGDRRGLSLDYRAVLSRVEGWKQTTSVVETRISIADTGLGQLEKIAQNARGAFRSDDFVLVAGQTVGQKMVRDQFAQVVEVLNGNAGGRFLYGGRQTGSPPVIDSATIRQGSGTKDGFDTTLRERLQADLGSSLGVPERDGAARGRLALTGANAVPVVLAEDGVHGFGMKIQGVNGAIGGVATSVAAGPPASATFAAGAGTTSVGDAVTLSLKLPDGTNETITLSVAPPEATSLGRGQFKAGATPADTMENLRVVLDLEVKRVALTSLVAASASKAGEEFFRGETDPVRLAGPPPVEAGGAIRLQAGPSGTFADATQYLTAAQADAKTVRWYVGDRQSADPRATASASIDDQLSVSYGMRADETGFRVMLQTLAVASSLTFSNEDGYARDRYQAVDGRVRTALSPDGDVAPVTAIRIDLSIAQTNLAAAKERHTQTEGMMSTLLEKVEGAETETIAAQILTLQTQLQASYQTTALISRLSLVQYLG